MFFLRALLLAAGAVGFSTWPSVSVQMVTYKRGPLLLEALAQVEQQEYPGDLEVVIVDDSPESQEEQLDALKESLAIRYIFLPERMSIGAKRNLATRSTDAEVICIWDDDDVFTMDRIRKQVEHLRGADVNCSGIEVASFYSVPDQELTVRPLGLPPIVFENTLCFTRTWWESGHFGFGEAWEVSGQGEGTLEPWWEQVKTLSGAEEPFLYIYLPSSASGGTALNKNRQPPPCSKLFALASALSHGRFPELPGPHVSSALSCARAEVQELLSIPKFLDEPSVIAAAGIQRRSVAERQRVQLTADFPSDPALAARSSVARHVSHGGDPVWGSVSDMYLKRAAELQAAVRLDAFGVRDRGGFAPTAAAERLRYRAAEALGVEVSHLEPLRAVRYGRPEQCFEPHVDWIADPSDEQLLELGQRVASLLVFLSTLPEGRGQTDFPALGVSVTPQTGAALLWPNMDMNGQPLPEMIHEAKPLEEEGLEKIALNVWVRDRPLPTDPAILETLFQS
ncbi:2-oxoglutarate-4-dioxygenase subunit alpha-1) [Durusdinium trenchii]|uniref:2-oxoglutarate-4-dioxygenase subunit alpha-1 n=1 Tax=Durusdinium trenchii TaxID=1381693 RepID=A0ABP0QH03_9DINO